MRRVLSLGAGVQSTTMLLMALEGELEMPDCAIFADTGWEPRAVYEHLAWLESYAAKRGFPVYRASAGNLRDDAVAAVAGGNGRLASMPFFVKNPDGSKGVLRRQCTYEYKIAPIRRKVKELYGSKVKAELWLGISLDEVERMKPSDVKWLRNRWPLIEKRMTRLACLRWLEANGFPLPPRSSCIGCPYHDDAFWRALRDEFPEEWQDAVEFDRMIRHLPRIKGDVYLHRSLVPLDEVDLSTPEDHGQLTLFIDECEGMCGL